MYGDGILTAASTGGRVVVVGGGNAALCAALSARLAGASVLLLERSEEWDRGGNSKHTRNIRCVRDAGSAEGAYTPDEMLEALAANFSAVPVGDPFDEANQMGPLVSERQRDRVEGYIAKGREEGAILAAGGGRPEGLDRGWYVQPTVFGNVDNRSTIAQEEIFGPVLSVIPAADEADAVRLANDTIYGLNASVFTHDVDRARAVAGQIRSGTVGHNAFRTDFGIAFGGFKQSGIGREGATEGLLPFLETKTVILEDTPSGY